MIILYCSRKLLNVSRIKPVLYISEESEGQFLHHWNARLFSSGFAGKLFVMYVHEPSLMTIICPGKTISSTWETFVERLFLTLNRHHFKEEFIRNELKFTKEYIVSKTNSKSILSYMNQMVFELEYQCSRAYGYKDIDLNFFEEGLMSRIHSVKGSGNYDYSYPIKYWKEHGVIVGD